LLSRVLRYVHQTKPLSPSLVRLLEDFLVKKVTVEFACNHEHLAVDAVIVHVFDRPPHFESPVVGFLRDKVNTRSMDLHPAGKKIGQKILVTSRLLAFSLECSPRNFLVHYKCILSTVLIENSELPNRGFKRRGLLSSNFQTFHHVHHVCFTPFTRRSLLLNVFIPHLLEGV